MHPRGTARRARGHRTPRARGGGSAGPGDLDRRTFLQAGLAGVGAALGSRAAAASPRARVIVIRAEDRTDGMRRALALLGPVPLARKHVVVKPNLNSADPFPGSTHPDTLAALVAWLDRSGAARVTVADRSGMGVTRRVMEAKGLFAQGRRLGFPSVPLDELSPRDWVPRPLAGGHWRRGVLFPRLLEEAEAIVSTCCLKTHRFGGQVTLSLKNSVGMVAKHGPDGYDYMDELHGARAQRRMIAELNQLYQPAAVLLDGLEAFVRGGPEAGTKVAPGVLIAGTDRVAVDAVGIAVLRLYDTTPEVAGGPVFAQEQLARAVALGLGVTGPGQIDLVTDDAAGEAFLTRVRPVLARA